MVLTAVRGALGFLTRLPVGSTEATWDAFTNTPASVPLAGYVIGAIIALPLVLPGPSPTVALLFVSGVYLVTGITHIDGVADFGDAIATHGSPDERKTAMTDTAVGAGGVLAVGVVLLGVGTAGFVLAGEVEGALTGSAATVLFLVVTAEVGAKVGMALVICLGSPTHDGLGATVASNAGPRSIVPVALTTVPVLVLAWPTVMPVIVTLLAAIIAALGVFLWARANLGGVSGDVLGAANEVGRIAALHAGVIAWMHL